MSKRQSRIEQLVRLARGKDESSVDPTQNVSAEIITEQHACQDQSADYDTSSTYCSSEALDVNCSAFFGLNTTSYVPSEVANYETVEIIQLNPEDTLLLSSNILESVDVGQPVPDNASQLLAQHTVESVEPTHDNSLQPLLNVPFSHDAAIPDPSEYIVNITNQNSGEDFSSGSSETWQPPQIETMQEESSSDSESALENVDPQDPTDVPNDDNVQSTQLQLNTSNKRKKGHGPMQRKLRKIRTECRNKGKEYVTAKGKCIPAKVPPNRLSDCCRAQCHTKTEQLDLKKMFEDYRNLPSRDCQKRYLGGLLKIKPKESSKRNANIKKREVTVCYTIDGVEGSICKKCFIKVFAESRGFIDDIVKKKKNSSTSIIIDTDLRSTRRRPGNERSEADKTFAKDFINTFPAYESHYSRIHTSKRYLEQSLNFQLLYSLYKEKFENTRSDPSSKPLSQGVFRIVFKSLNLKFKKPSNDTCKTCDSYFLKIKSCESDEERQRLESERAEHQNKTKFHYDTKKIDKERSNNSGGQIVVAAFDLQKCLPTPNLTASVSFYKRKLWTFNLTVRNITSKRTSCYVWYEGVAQRGADEIASCLWHFINSLPEEVEELILYSDTCPGQNRNNILPVMFSMVLERKTSLKKIYHKFLVPGHTHLECDSDHAAIERFVKNRNCTISVPQDWVSVIKLTNNRYDVQLMRQTDFFGFSKLLTTHFIKRNIAKDKMTFAWNSIFCLSYEKSNDVGFKYTLEEEEPFRFFSILRRGKSLAGIELPLAYDEPINIDILKYKDIQDLLPFIDPMYHAFYKNLPHTGATRQTYLSDSEDNYEEA